MEEFDWIIDIEPKQFGSFNIGDKFIVINHKFNLVYTIESVIDNNVRVSWRDDMFAFASEYYLDVVKFHFADGIWILV